tara:strand:- start:354 stop:914 length:561 start_codon:yes stop_codon:yes gene_type:complete
MIKQNLIIYSIPILSEILKEIEDEINFSIVEISNLKELNKQNLTSSLVLINNNKDLDFANAIKLDFPIKVTKLIEKINIQFIRIKTKETSRISIGDYELNLNAKILKLNEKFISLTEKETDLIIYLNKSGGPVKVEELESEVWGYKNKIETHTVETHIHRLRKKILIQLDKDSFILSNKSGYYLSK